MIGWLSLLGIAAALAAGAWLAVGKAARRWPDYIAIFAIAALLLVPFYEIVTGDISRVLPTFIWSDGPDGKDQIILASIVATFMLPVIVAASIWRAARAVRARLTI